jgi:2-iminobutanoate/2-iminopropanoate deaminase
MVPCFGLSFVPFLKRRSRIIFTDLAPAAIGPYSQAVLSPDKKTLYVSGCIGLKPGTTTFAGPSIEEQARQALENLVAIVTEAGGTAKSVVKTTVLLTNDMSAYASVNKIYTEFFSEAKPARAAFAVSALPAGALIEIECVACL